MSDQLLDRHKSPVLLANDVFRMSNSYFIQLRNFVTVEVDIERNEYTFRVLNNNVFPHPMTLRNLYKESVLAILDDIAYLYAIVADAIEEMNKNYDGSENMSYGISILEEILDSIERYGIVLLTINDNDPILYGKPSEPPNSSKHPVTLSIIYCLRQLYPDMDRTDINSLVRDVRDVALRELATSELVN